MKIFTYILTAIAIVLVIYNITLINLEAPFQGESMSAFITILAGLCAVLLLQILRISKKIELKSKGK
jgi:uncharacterized protein YhhL (DUF1145 family)